MSPKIKKYNQLKVEEENQQLTLFEMLGNENRPYSNTLEIYNFMPKYVWGKQDKRRIDGRFLESIDREFVCRKIPYKLKMYPARITDAGGKEKEYYLGKREAIIEDALIKLIVEGNGVMIDGNLGIKFSLYQLLEELKKTGHEYKRSDIKESIRILQGVRFVLMPQNNEKEIAFSPIESYGFAGEEEETVTFVKLSFLITQVLKSKKFRLYNYERVMGYKNVIARELEKRISHNHTTASFTNPYHIMLSTIIRDFGLTQYATLSNNIRDVESALEEMVVKKSILSYKVDKVFDQKRKNALKDAKFTLVLFNLHDDITKANVRSQKIKGKDKESPQNLFTDQP